MKVRQNTKKLSKLSFEKKWVITTLYNGKKIFWNIRGKFGRK